MKLHTKILIALVAGAVVGAAANLSGNETARQIVVNLQPIGTAFIRLITMVVVPLVIASLLLGTASLGDIHRLGRIGGRTLVFFLCTTILAASIGLVLSHLMQPGTGLDPSIREGLAGQFLKEAQGNVAVAKQANVGLVQTLVNIIPRNPFQAMAEMDLLGIIFFTLLFGAAAGLLPDELRVPFLGFFEGLSGVTMRVIGWVMKIAPYGVFALIASVVARFGLDLLRSLAFFVLVVVIGQLIQGLGVFGLVVRFLIKVNPFTYYRRIARVTLMAFSTSSSNATLPIAIETARTELGISKAVSGFVLPLAATINMNGSALYKTVCVMFIANTYGIHLDAGQQLTMIIAATLSAIAGAGVPGSGMVTILIVLNAVGMGDIAAAGVALVIGVDRILDMVRTAVNCTGDIIACTYIAKCEGEDIMPPREVLLARLAQENGAGAEEEEEEERIAVAVGA